MGILMTTSNDSCSRHTTDFKTNHWNYFLHFKLASSVSGRDLNLYCMSRENFALEVMTVLFFSKLQGYLAEK